MIKGGKYLEKMATVDTVVFDKTGTLTKGKPEVTEVIPFNGYDETYVLQIASSSEVKSEHPIAQAIVKKAHEKNIAILEVSDFNSITGQGIVAKYNEQRILVVSPRSKNSIENNVENTIAAKSNSLQNTVIPKEPQSKIFELESEGKTVVTVFRGQISRVDCSCGCFKRQLNKNSKTDSFDG